jgi:hypothetical protein
MDADWWLNPIVRSFEYGYHSRKHCEEEEENAEEEEEEAEEEAEAENDDDSGMLSGESCVDECRVPDVGRDQSAEKGRTAVAAGRLAHRSTARHRQTPNTPCGCA